MLNFMLMLVSPLEITILYKYITHNYTQAQSSVSSTEEINIKFNDGFVIQVF